MKRSVCGALLVLVLAGLMAWPPSPVAAQGSGLSMSVTAGLDGYCRQGKWCPLYVVLSNEGEDVEGYLRVYRAGDDYSLPVTLPAHSRKGYSLLVSLSSSLSRITLPVRLASGNDVLITAEADVEVVDPANRIYGVVSDSPSALNFLADVSPSGGRAVVAHLNLGSLPVDPLGWETLDVLVLTDVDTSGIDDGRKQALETWLAHGGHLIVGGGAGAMRTASGVPDLLPVQVGGTRSVDELWALSREIGTAQAAGGPYAVAEATLTADASLLVEQDGLPLVVRRQHGAGRVDFLAFDAALNPFRTWDDNARLWRTFVGDHVDGVVGLAVRSDHQARSAISAIPGLQPLSMWQLLLFMLAYILLIGPINYVVLRKLDRRELAWLTIPALIIGFTACSYFTGFQVRGPRAIVHHIAAVYVPQESGTGRVTQLVGLFSPRRTSYDLFVPGAKAHQGRGEETQRVVVVQAPGGTAVEGLQVDVGGIEPLFAEGYASVPAVASSLRLVGSDSGELLLEGTVSSLEVSLKDAVLLMGQRKQTLGDLPAGGSFDVSQALPASPSLSYSSSSDVPDWIMGSGGYWNDPILYRRYHFLSALFPYGEPNPLEGGVYLVGWSDGNAPFATQVMNKLHTTQTTVFYVYEIPVMGLETGGLFSIGSHLFSRQVESTTGYIDTSHGTHRLGPASEVVYRFEVFSGVRLEAVEQVLLTIDGYSETNAAYWPAVELWNWENEAWDEFDFDWGTHSVPDADRYVESPGILLLRLKNDSDGYLGMDTLEISVKGWQ